MLLVEPIVIKNREVCRQKELRTKKRIHDSAVYLTKQYPNLCTLNTGKKSGYTEVRLRDRRENQPHPYGCSKKNKKRNGKKTKKNAHGIKGLHEIDVDNLPINKC